ncbi:hypothetical protein C6Y40_05290 [Alteromonas alba]|uniref:Uncharacterized protein n=1 Tax=Alteromonas alba TaxID=2079529 RepID=A0A2S9VDY4_9ALTE|nr:hypothetical protein C6Y40_05290 [Alteromonas alba]
MANHKEVQRFSACYTTVNTLNDKFLKFYSVWQATYNQFCQHNALHYYPFVHLFMLKTDCLSVFILRACVKSVQRQ